MGYYVIAIGGTGNKILESLVYAACADALYTLDERGARVPIPRLNLLSVDVDAACGNTTRAKRAAEYYENVRALYRGGEGARRLFHTELRLERWGMNLSRRAASVDKMAQNHRQDQLLSRALFDRTEASLEYGEGFRGHPDLGVLFFADLLQSLAETEREGQTDELLDLLARVRADIDRGETARVMLCGSIFGGTGASGIPSLARFLRERFRDRADLLELGGMLMLPYYRVPASTRDEGAEIVVKSSAFLDKARTALQYYGMAGMIRDGEADETGAFDALYLLGLPPESFVTARNYSTGSQSQENDAHMLEWLASRLVTRFLRTGFRGPDARNIDCYYYQWHTPDFRWQSFDDEADLYRQNYGALLKAATAFFAECYPTVRAAIAGGKAKEARCGYCAPYFGYAPRMNAAARERLRGALDSLYQFLAFYVRWFTQVVRTLPPTMRPKSEAEEREALAASEYAALVRRAALLPPDAADDTERDRALREEYGRMLAARDARVRQLGGARWLELLRGAWNGARENLDQLENDVETLRDRIALAEGEDSRLADPRAVREEREQLAAMLRALAFQRRQADFIGAEIEAAVRENLAQTCPAPPEESDAVLPRNALADAALLDELRLLLVEYGKDARDRDHALMTRARERLQRGLHRLLLSGAPDRRDMARVVSGLGGGECDRKRPDAALAGFLSTLVDVVMEVEGE